MTGGPPAEPPAGHVTVPAPTLDGAVLAIIDAQRVFAEPGSPWAAPRFAATVPVLRALAAAHAGPTVLTRFVAPEHPAGAWGPYYDEWPFALQPADAPLWDVVPELADLVVDGRTVDATTFGKWAGLAPLVAKAASPGRTRRLVLGGVSTDCCVLSTALAAADAGVEVLVVADACAGADDASHTRALEAMALYAPLVRVVPSSALLPAR